MKGYGPGITEHARIMLSMALSIPSQYTVRHVRCLVVLSHSSIVCRIQGAGVDDLEICR